MPITDPAEWCFETLANGFIHGLHRPTQTVTVLNGDGTPRHGAYLAAAAYAYAKARRFGP